MSKEFPSKTKKGATIVIEAKLGDQSFFSFATVAKISRKGKVETFLKGGLLFMVDDSTRVMTILDPALQAAAQAVAAENKGRIYNDAQEVRDAIMTEAEKNSKKVA